MNPPRLGRLKTNTPNANQRLKLWYGVLLLIIGLFIVRLFYLQIIQHDHYKQAAYADQLKQYTITPDRGLIEAHQGSNTLPLVLNQKLYTLYADPTLVKGAATGAQKLAAITHGDAGEYQKAMTAKPSRYQILAKRLSEQQHKQIASLKLAGIGTQKTDYRTYPQGSLAAQLLGYVNAEGKGTYGIEQSLNKQLAGTPGLLKAITDANGVPLVASRDNVQVDPKAGDDIVLTIDAAMQKQLETLLKQGLDRASSKSGSAIIMDPSSGAIKAMTNYPTYDPSQYYKVTDASVFNNATVSSPLEVGSVMKVLTASAALNQGVIKPDTSYYDPSFWELDGHKITNIEEDGGAGTHNIADILNLSINTGATWMLMQMGGGKINPQARDRWHDYMVNHYGFSKQTGVEQGYEASGYIPDPEKGYALSLTYANTAFGQAMTATPLQMVAALSSVLNGGTYYQPRLVDQVRSSNGKITAKKPVIVKKNVVSGSTSSSIQSLMEYVVDKHHLTPAFSPNYSVGGKTGTAQIADPAGGYYANKYNGTYMGFVGGDKPQYVIMVRVNQPAVGGYAGTAAAQPVFSALAHMLIDNFNVIPKSGT